MGSMPWNPTLFCWVLRWHIVNLWNWSIDFSYRRRPNQSCVVHYHHCGRPNLSIALPPHMSSSLPMSSVFLVVCRCDSLCLNNVTFYPYLTKLIDSNLWLKTKMWLDSLPFFADINCRFWKSNLIQSSDRLMLNLIKPDTSKSNDQIIFTLKSNNEILG